MLLAEFVKSFVYGAHTTRLEIRIPLADTFHRFPIVLPFPFQGVAQNFVQRSCRVLPVPKGIIIQLRLALGRKLYFHVSSLRTMLKRVNQNHATKSRNKGALPPCRSPGIFRFRAKAGWSELRSGQPEDRAMQGCNPSAELEAGAGGGEL